jgi:hypothetical protein
MPRTCTVCAYLEAFAINEALVVEYANVPIARRIDAQGEWFLDACKKLEAPRDCCPDCLLRFVRVADELDKTLRLPNQCRSPIPRSVRLRVIARDSRTCSYCKGAGDDTHGPDGKPWHIDHKVTYSRGGAHDESNFALACCTCNVRKSDREDWGPSAA